METLNNDELYYIAKFLKPEDLIRFKNTSRKLQSIIHESTILADRAYWQNYTKNHREKRKELQIPILNYIIYTTYNHLRKNKHKIELIRNLTNAETGQMKQIINLLDSTSITDKWPMKHHHTTFNEELESRLINLHQHLQKLCKAKNKEHITAQCAAHNKDCCIKGPLDLKHDLCILENTIYNYIKKVQEVQIIAIYTLITLNQGNLKESIRKALNIERVNIQKEPTFLEQLMYLLPRDFDLGKNKEKEAQSPRLVHHQTKLLEILDSNEEK